MNNQDKMDSSRRRRPERRKLFCCWKCSDNMDSPITVGLLIYIALFQLALYNSNNSCTKTSSMANVQQIQQLTIPHRQRISLEKQQSHQTLTSLQGRGREGVLTENYTSFEWQSFRPANAPVLNIPLPVFVTSLPKSGTTSIWRYFQCGEQMACHNWITKQKKQKGVTTTAAATPVGMCILDNILAKRRAFQDCGENDIFIDTGYLNYDNDKGMDCYFPSVDGLEAIYQSYPTATLIHIRRNVEDWYDSLKTWSHSSVFLRFRLCNATGFPNGQSTKADWFHFYEWHTNMIRNFIQRHSSLTFIEVELESPTTGKILQESTGIPSTCWKKCRPDVFQCEPIKGEQQQDVINSTTTTAMT